VSNTEFFKIIKEDLIEVSIPKTSHFSLGTSPYYAHQNGLAIDIYHKLSLENYKALSPIKGIVIKSKELIAPKPRFSDGINKEYLTLIQGKNKLKIFKILHVKPSVKVGDKIEVGDEIGSTIKNGYFASWSSPHIHLEIRPRDDVIRARGGESFSLLFDNTEKLNINNNGTQENYKYIPLTIVSVFEEFILARLPEDLYHKINPFLGVKGKISDYNCIIDGGIPLYKRGVILLDNNHHIESKSLRMINSAELGNLWNQRDCFGFIDYNPVKFYLNDKPIRGISLFIANIRPLIKIIPYDLKDHNFEINSTQILTIQV